MHTLFNSPIPHQSTLSTRSIKLLKIVHRIVWILPGLRPPRFASSKTVMTATCITTTRPLRHALRIQPQLPTTVIPKRMNRNCRPFLVVSIIWSPENAALGGACGLNSLSTIISNNVRLLNSSRELRPDLTGVFPPIFRLANCSAAMCTRLCKCTNGRPSGSQRREF